MYLLVHHVNVWFKLVFSAMDMDLAFTWCRPGGIQSPVFWVIMVLEFTVLIPDSTLCWIRVSDNVSSVEASINTETPRISWTWSLYYFVKSRSWNVFLVSSPAIFCLQSGLLASMLYLLTWRTGYAISRYLKSESILWPGLNTKAPQYCGRWSVTVEPV